MQRSGNHRGVGPGLCAPRSGVRRERNKLALIHQHDPFLRLAPLLHPFHPQGRPRQRACPGASRAARPAARCVCRVPPRRRRGLCQGLLAEAQRLRKLLPGRRLGGGALQQALQGATEGNLSCKPHMVARLAGT